MNEQLTSYISSKRAEGVNDQEIKANLVSAGWQENMVEQAISGKQNDAPPPPPSAQASPQPASPVAVVQTYSTKGLEYIIMFISLWVTATSIAFLLHSLVNNIFGSENYFFDTAPIASAALIVSLPIFSILFIRLKKAEREDPQILKDPSRRRAVQLTLVVTFIVGLWNVIGYLYSLLNVGTADSYLVESSQSGVANLLHTIISLVIAGGIFFYYWREEHKKV